MRDWIIRGFFLALLFQINACASKPVNEKQAMAPQATQTHLEMSLEDLALVGQYLQNATENKGLTCSLPAEQLSAMMTVYRAFVDEKYSEEQEIYLKKPLKEKVRYWNNKCEATCSCDTYIGFSEYLQSFNFLLSATEKAVIEKLEAKAKIESAARIACMNQGPWVCQSRVLNTIRKKVENKR